MTEAQYLAMEEKAKAAFDKMPDRLAGNYFPLKGASIGLSPHLF